MTTVFLPPTICSSQENALRITLMTWGNAIVRSRDFGPSGQVRAVTMELQWEGDFRLTTKKVTWLATSSTKSKLVDVTLLDYDYLTTKKKLDVGDELSDFVNPVSEFREEALADPNALHSLLGISFNLSARGITS